MLSYALVHPTTKEFDSMLFTSLCSMLLATSMFGATQSSDLLLKKYLAMRTSIINQRGLAPGDLDVVRNLCDEMGVYNAANDDIRPIAAELQMCIWLKDDDRSAALFQRLSSLQPDNFAIALAWAEFMLSQDGANPEKIYTDLIQRYPDSPEIVLGWVKYLDGLNRFTDGIKAINRLDQEALSSSSTAEIYADLLYADNRFEEAVEVLEQVNQIELAGDPVLSSKIGAKLDTYRNIETRWDKEVALREMEDAADDLPRATIITSKGLILIELFEDHAQNTVANFISLADSGYYDGTRFHRVLPKFMIQGGDPNSREGAEGLAGQGGPGYNIADEHAGDDYREHFAGTLSMAKSPAPNTAGSQFFLTHLPTPHLDGRHTVFGRVLSGLDIVRSIEVNDYIVTISITRKRDHDYTPATIGGEKAAQIKVPPTLSSDKKSE